MDTQDQSNRSQIIGKPMSLETFQELLQLRKQIKQNHPGQIFDDSTEIIRQMREERSQYLANL